MLLPKSFLPQKPCEEWKFDITPGLHWVNLCWLKEPENPCVTIVNKQDIEELAACIKGNNLRYPIDVTKELVVINGYLVFLVMKKLDRRRVLVRVVPPASDYLTKHYESVVA